MWESTDELCLTLDNIPVIFDVIILCEACLGNENVDANVYKFQIVLSIFIQNINTYEQPPQSMVKQLTY